MSDQKPGVHRYEMLKSMVAAIDLATNSLIKKLLGGGNIEPELDVIESQMKMIRETCEALKEEWKDL